MATLYRKYRPQNFEEVVGQNHIKITLEHEIKSGKIAHAYLFSGPRAVGKTTLARVMAKAINCEKKKKDSSEPCNKCQACEEITAGRALDVIEIDAASHTGVDHVRENIIANARVAPSRYKYKVFIIDEVHMLSISAFNALLKVIEEPPEYVIFILCTTEVHKVPTTIISRCQRFDFKRISVSDIVRKLNYIIKAEGIKIEKTILEAIARQSEGHMRDAESILGQIVAIGGKEISQEEADLVIPRSDLGEVVNLIAYLAKRDVASGIKMINKLVDEGVDLKVFLSDLIEVLRKIMLTKINPNLTQKLSLELGESLEIKVNQISQDLTEEQLLNFIKRFIQARSELKGSFIIQLPLELAIAELCSATFTSLTPSPRFAGEAGNLPPTSVVPATKLGAGTGGRNSFSNALNVKTNSTVSPTVKAVTGVKPGQVAQVNTTAKLGQDQLIEKWNEVLAKIKQYNHSLSFILRVCQPRDLAGNQLCLAFKYKFHKDRVNEPNIKASIERVLHQVYGLPLTIEAVIDENLEVAQEKLVSNDNVKADDETKEKKDNLVDNLLKTFGGKVVE